VLVPGGAKSPAILSESEAVLAFLRQVNGERKLVAPICTGGPLCLEGDCPGRTGPRGRTS
jgi:putative intracellular protease/amidase